MAIISENYRVTEIKNLAFEKVPRASLISDSSRIALDYHADLCNLKLGDIVKLGVFQAVKPTVDRNCYLMRGIIYKIEENRFEASFGGLLMFYEGKLDENIALEAEVFVAVARV